MKITNILGDVRSGDRITSRTTTFDGWDKCTYSFRVELVVKITKLYVTTENGRYSKHSGLKAGDIDIIAIPSTCDAEVAEYSEIINPALIISLSAGHTSAFLGIQASALKDKLLEIYSDITFIFANTGDEHEESIKFMNRLDGILHKKSLWVEAKVNNIKNKGTRHSIVDFHTASRNGEPLKAIASKYGLPSFSIKTCTRESKQAPIKSLAKDLYGDNYRMAIGIRLDEKSREGSAKEKKNHNLIYPLLDMGVTKGDVIDFWKKRKDGLAIENYMGNCKVCHAKSENKLRVIYAKDKSSFDVFIDMENKYSRLATTHKKKGGVVFYRKYRTAKDMKDMFDSEALVDIDRLEKKIVERYEAGGGGGCSEDCAPFSRL